MHLVIVLFCLSATALARDLPLSYMNEGDVCRILGREKWTCQLVEKCPRGMTQIGANRPCGIDEVIPLTCCPPDNRLQRERRPQESIANRYCEKYMEDECGGVIGKDWMEMEDLTPPLFVAGGSLASGKEFPHMALIGFGQDKTWACGGSLISERFVLSAAHCASQYILGPARWVRLGELDYESTEDDASPMDFEIVERIVHPGYTPPQLYNDIALFKLDREVKFSPWIKPICLHNRPTVPYRTATAAGWGRTGPANGLSSALMSITIDMVDKSTCKKLVKAPIRIPHGVSDKTMLCAGDMTGFHDTCMGDSGGPLQVTFSNRCLPTIVGVTSFGWICTAPNTPGVYTRVNHYVPWIESIVWSNATRHHHHHRFVPSHYITFPKKRRSPK